MPAVPLGRGLDHTEGMTGTNETSFEADSGSAGCRCGRVHSAAAPPRRRLRRPEERLGEKLYAALLRGDAVQDPRTRIWWVNVAGNCDYPGVMNASDIRHVAKRLVRCRKCGPCRRVRRNRWAYAAMHQAEVSEALGHRTWFGTLTLSPESQEIMRDRARSASSVPNAEWWDDPKCDEAFSLVRDQLVSECRRYWARLRKSGHRFKYLLVFERHKSGMPHMHFLLHEQNGPIRKSVLEAQWPWGFSKPILCGGGSKRTLTPKRAAFYVAKYLDKDIQARQIASHGYRPCKRACRHRPLAGRDPTHPPGTGDQVSDERRKVSSAG